MASKNVRLELNRAGVRELLLSDEVGDDLQRRAERVASKAGPGFKAERDTQRRVRSASRVVTRTKTARKLQADHNVLVRSLGAAE